MSFKQIDFRRFLPIRPRLEDGESLSSWLARTAQENACDIRTLGEFISVSEDLFDDIDDRASYEFLNSATMLTGVAARDLLRASFTDDRDLANDWLQSVHGDRPTIAERGMQYCPDCLRTDENPYFRRNWRLSLVTICPIHRRYLAERCVSCMEQVHAADGGLLAKNPDREGAPPDLLNCRICKHDLRIADEKPTQEAVLRGLEFVNCLIGEYSSDFRDHRLLGPVVDFMVSPAAIKFRTEVARRSCQLDPLQGAPSKIHYGFSAIEPERRAGILSLAIWLIRNWEQEFESIARSCPNLQSAGMRHRSYWDFRDLNNIADGSSTGTFGLRRYQ